MKPDWLIFDWLLFQYMQTHICQNVSFIQEDGGHSSIQSAMKYECLV